MADLNESTAIVTVKKWDRSNSIKVDNSYGQQPSILFGIESARLENDTDYSSTYKGQLAVTFDTTEVYPLLNPVDDTVIDPTGGNHTMLQLQLYSLFKYRAALQS
jgi:hypothetical protein